MAGRYVHSLKGRDGGLQMLNVYQHQRIKTRLISPSLARVFKVETVPTQGNARKLGDENARKMPASEENMEGTRE